MRQEVEFDKLMGFTLIELMIAIVIVSILTAVAFPSYQNYVRQSNRAAAKAILYENAQFMEQFYTENSQYDATVGEDGIANTGDDMGVVLPIVQSPRRGVALYTISVQPPPEDARFTLRAVPVGTMAGDACGTYTLTNTGIQGLQGASGTVADCWNR
jgi:type IV pilus assembly protein PilE